MKRFLVLFMVTLLTFGIAGCSTKASGKAHDDKAVFREKIAELADRATQSRKNFAWAFAQYADGNQNQGIFKMGEAVKEMTSVRDELLDLKVPDQYRDIHSKMFDAVRLMLEIMQLDYEGVSDNDQSKLAESNAKKAEFPYNWEEVMNEVKNLK